jgi:hypothetical protein
MFTGRMIALCFALSKAKATIQAGTAIKSGMFNPYNPEICPVHALVCYIFSNPGAFSANVDEKVNKHEEDGVEVEAHGGDGPSRPAPNCNRGRLFPGQFQYERFMSCLHWIVEKYPVVFFELGISPGNLGSHSARKGASSHACAGTAVSPPMVSI